MSPADPQGARATLTAIYDAMMVRGEDAAGRRTTIVHEAEGVKVLQAALDAAWRAEVEAAAQEVDPPEDAEMSYERRIRLSLALLVRALQPPGADAGGG